MLFLSLKPLDIEVMKHLGSRVNLIPIIAKADTLTPKDLAQYKLNVSKAKNNRKVNMSIYFCCIFVDFGFYC